MATGARPGPVSRQVTVLTNDRNNPTFALEGSMTVMAAVKVEPASANFVQVPRNAPAQTVTLKLMRGDDGPLNPTLVPSTNPTIQAELREIEAGERYDLVVTVSPPWPNALLRGNVIVQTGIAEAPQELVPVSVTAVPRLMADPTILRVPPKVDADLDLKAKLVWSDNSPGKVVETTVNEAKCRVEVTEQDGEQVVVLHVPAGYMPSRAAGLAVTVKTDDHEVPALQIPIATGRQTATSLPKPAISATRPTLVPPKPSGPRPDQQ